MALFVLSDKEHHDANLLRVLQIVLGCFSLMFLYILYNGWSSLFSHNGVLVSTIGAAVLAFLAWGLGRYIGSSDGSLVRKWPLFVFLLILSAAGVFNWMMITLEGKTIFLEAVANAEDAFTRLESSARKNVGDTVLAAKETVVKAKEQAFLTEVRNPLNCGYGRIANQRLAELVAALPNLHLPSATRSARSTDECNRRADIYRDAIDAEWNGSEDGKKLEGVRQTQSGITAKIDQIVTELSNLRDRASNEGVPFVLGAGRNSLDDMNETYKRLLDKVNVYAPDNDLPKHLDLTTISRLGEWSQIFSVIGSRLDQLSTYVYLALSVFMDFMLYYLFREYRTMRLRQPRQFATTSTAVRHLGSGEP